MDANTLDEVNGGLRLVDREIWLVTSGHRDRRGGLVATWVTVSSLDPDRPIVTVALAESHFTTELVVASRSLALHLITAEQIDLAWQLALESGRGRDKLAGLELRAGATGAPLLRNCLAWFDCRVFAEHRLGDRVYFWGQVVDGGMPGQGAPLRQRGLFAAANPEQLTSLRASLVEDIERERRASPLTPA